MQKMSPQGTSNNNLADFEPEFILVNIGAFDIVHSLIRGRHRQLKAKYPDLLARCESDKQEIDRMTAMLIAKPLASNQPPPKKQAVVEQLYSKKLQLFKTRPLSRKHHYHASSSGNPTNNKTNRSQDKTSSQILIANNSLKKATHRSVNKTMHVQAQGDCDANPYHHTRFRRNLCQFNLEYDEEEHHVKQATFRKNARGAGSNGKQENRGASPNKTQHSRSPNNKKGF